MANEARDAFTSLYNALEWYSCRQTLDNPYNDEYRKLLWNEYDDESFKLENWSEVYLNKKYNKRAHLNDGGYEIYIL